MTDNSNSAWGWLRQGWRRAALRPTPGLLVGAMAAGALAWVAQDSVVRIWALFALSAVVAVLMVHAGRRDHDADQAYREELLRTRQLLYAALLAAPREDGRGPAGTDGPQLSPQLAGRLVEHLVHRAQLVSDSQAFILGRRLVAGDLQAAKIQEIIDEVTVVLGDESPSPEDAPLLLNIDDHVAKTPKVKAPRRPAPQTIAPETIAPQSTST